MSDIIYIIRHAEKPGTPIDAPGIDPYSGMTDDPASLTAAGWQRARALVNLFHPAGASERALAEPNHLFAPSVHLPESSKRSLQTLLPLALSFDPPLTIDSRFHSGAVAGLAAAVQAAPGVVLVAWKHERILDIAARLAPHATLPESWPKLRFDVIFIFRRNAAGSYDFAQTAERVLLTDSDTTL
jgi:hypothetical protein